MSSGGVGPVRAAVVGVDQARYVALEATLAELGMSLVLAAATVERLLIARPDVDVVVMDAYAARMPADLDVIDRLREVYPVLLVSVEAGDGHAPSPSSEATTVLSPREEQAIRLVAEGFTHRQAARRLGVTESTFDTYIKRIRHKLGVGNKAELTRAALSLTPLPVS